MEKLNCVKISKEPVPSQRTHTSLKRLQDVLKKSWYLTIKPDVVTTCCKRRLIYDVLKTCKTSYERCLEEVWLTLSWRHLIYDILKTSNLHCLEDVRFTMSWRRLTYDVLKTSNLWRLEDIQFRMSWRGFYLQRLQDVCKTRLCSNVVVTSLKRRKKWIFLIIFRKF